MPAQTSSYSYVAKGQRYGDKGIGYLVNTEFVHYRDPYFGLK